MFVFVGVLYVSVTKDINATFSEALNPLTVNNTTFSLATTSKSIPVDGVVSYSGKTISFNPDDNLASGTNYTATITTAVEDLAGNALAAKKVWSFTTALLPVTVAAISPKNGDINVSTKLDSITAEFNVDMNSSTLTTSSFWLTDDATDTNVSVGAVTYLNKVAELNITAVLAADTNYTATISTDAKGANGVTLLENYNWTFTTGNSADIIPPEVNSTSPQDGSIDVPINKIITATFSEAMIPSSITADGNFSVKRTDNNLSVDGNVTYAVINKIASFKPDSNLSADTNYTARITTFAKDLAGNAMASDYNWTFKTEASINPPLVALGKASTFGIAATAGVTNTLTAPNTLINGDVVLKPTAECNGVAVDNMGGFGLCGGAAPDINGKVITPNYPDTTTAQSVIDDLHAAYLSITPANMPGGTAIAAGTTLGAPTGNADVLGDNYFTPGVYTSNTSILVTGDLTLDANFDPNATFVFQSASTIGSMPNARILLVNGAKASNVYWQAGSDATLQTGTTWNGNIFAYRDITMVTGAKSCGRLFAGAFTDGLFVFDSNEVSVPGNAFAPADCQ